MEHKIIELSNNSKTWPEEVDVAMKSASYLSVHPIHLDTLLKRVQTLEKLVDACVVSTTQLIEGNRNQIEKLVHLRNRMSEDTYERK